MTTDTRRELDDGRLRDGASGGGDGASGGGDGASGGGDGPVDAAVDTVVDVLAFAGMAAVFTLLAFTPRYAPDYGVQIAYLDQLKWGDVDPVGALLNNTVVLDWVIFPLHDLTGLSTDATLRLFYVGVFVAKYALLLRFCRPRAYVFAIFLWSFFSFDINQVRFNLAWVLLVLAFAGRATILASVGAVAAHLASALALPAVAIGWRLTRTQLALLAVGVAAAVAYAMVAGLTYDERFLEYLDTSGFWVPRALIAAPIMLLLVRGQFTPSTRWMLVGLALLPVAIATLRLATVSARFMEIVFTAFLIKLGADGVRLSPRNLVLVMAPGMLMFLSRAFSGINPSQP